MGRNTVIAVAFFGHAAAALLYARLDASDSVRGTIYFCSKIVVNAIPLIWVLAVERRRLTLSRPSRQSIVWGLATGLFIGLAIVALYYVGLGERLDAVAMRAKLAAYGVVDHFFLFAPFLCIVNSGLEEYYWRWFVYGQLRRSMPMTAAALLSALGFTLHHIVVLAAYVPDVSIVVLLNAGVFAGGVIWAVLYEKRASLYAPWLSHMVVDAAIMVAAYDLLFVV